MNRTPQKGISPICFVASLVHTLARERSILVVTCLAVLQTDSLAMRFRLIIPEFNKAELISAWYIRLLSNVCYAKLREKLLEYLKLKKKMHSLKSNTFQLI